MKTEQKIIWKTLKEELPKIDEDVLFKIAGETEVYLAMGFMTKDYYEDAWGCLSNYLCFYHTFPEEETEENEILPDDIIEWACIETEKICESYDKKTQMIDDRCQDCAKSKELFTSDRPLPEHPRMTRCYVIPIDKGE